MTQPLHLALSPAAGARAGDAVPQSLTLAPGRTLRLAGHRPCQLQVNAGRLWLTRPGVAEDQFIEAGQSVRVDGGGAVIESDGRVAARVQLQALGPAQPRWHEALRRVLHDLQRLVTGQAPPR